jgi:hypothetical protein
VDWARFEGGRACAEIHGTLHILPADKFKNFRSLHRIHHRANDHQAIMGLGDEIILMR